jgi:hypothetical protein
MLAATAIAMLAKSSASPTQRDETSWLTAAQHALHDPTWQCTPNWPTAKKIDLPDLGVIDQICARPSDEVSIIRYERTGSHGVTASGVIYDRSQALPIAEPDSFTRSTFLSVGRPARSPSSSPKMSRANLQ